MVVFSCTFHVNIVGYLYIYMYLIQLAARAGYHQAVRLLVERGGADVQERNATTGWVALHDAAFRGHVECVKVSNTSTIEMCPD